MGGDQEHGIEFRRVETEVVDLTDVRFASATGIAARPEGHEPVGESAGLALHASNCARPIEIDEVGPLVTAEEGKEDRESAVVQRVCDSAFATRADFGRSAAVGAIHEATSFETGGL
jgi:hypothetical protein